MPSQEIQAGARASKSTEVYVLNFNKFEDQNLLNFYNSLLGRRKYAYN